MCWTVKRVPWTYRQAGPFRPRLASRGGQASGIGEPKRGILSTRPTYDGRTTRQR
jgi:hypothetical protein